MAMKSKKPFNENYKNHCWTIIRKRDFINDVPICTLCEQEELLGDNQKFKLTLGHINIKNPKYREYHNSNHIVNITPQHFICNQRLEGHEFYKKHEQQLIKVIEKNIHYHNSYLAYKHQKILELKTMDISELKNIKSEIYDNLIPRFLDAFLQSSADYLDFSQTVDDITSFIYDLKHFGSQKSVETHLKKLCNPYSRRFIAERNQDDTLIIRLMTADECKKIDAFKAIFDNTPVKTNDNSEPSTFSTGSAWAKASHEEREREN